MVVRKEFHEKVTPEQGCEWSKGAGQGEEDSRQREPEEQRAQHENMLTWAGSREEHTVRDLEK